MCCTDWLFSFIIIIIIVFRLLILFCTFPPWHTSFADCVVRVNWPNLFISIFFYLLRLPSTNSATAATTTAATAIRIEISLSINRNQWTKWPTISTHMRHKNKMIKFAKYLIRYSSCSTSHSLKMEGNEKRAQEIFAKFAKTQKIMLEKFLSNYFGAFAPPFSFFVDYYQWNGGIRSQLNAATDFAWMVWLIFRFYSLFCFFFACDSVCCCFLLPRCCSNRTHKHTENGTQNIDAMHFMHLSSGINWKRKSNWP